MCVCHSHVTHKLVLYVTVRNRHSNWKGRKKSSINKPYPVKIHRNKLQQGTRFCPVFWLLTYLHYCVVVTL